MGQPGGQAGLGEGDGLSVREGDPGAVRLMVGEVHSPDLARDPETFVARIGSVPLTCPLMLFLEWKRKKGL